MKYILIFILIFFFCAEDPAVASRIITQHYTTGDGLAHNLVNCTLKDREGWVWFGTWYGLCRFDGLKFKEYNNRGEFFADIPPRKVQMIVEDKTGNLWVKTIDHKLYLFDKRREVFHSIFNEMENEFSLSSQIIKIQKTEDGEVLLLTKERDLLKAVSDREGKISFTLLHSSVPVEIHQKQKNNVFCETTTHIAWIGLDYKLYAFRKGKALEERPEDYIRHKIGETVTGRLTCAARDGESLWIGDERGQAWKINPQNGEVEKHTLSAEGKKVVRLVADRRYIYAALQEKGMVQYDLRTGKVQPFFPQVKAEQVTDLFFDSYDKLWIEGEGAQIWYYDPLNRREKAFRFETGQVQKNFTVQDGCQMGFYLLTPAGDVYRFNRGNLEMELLNAGIEEPETRARIRFFHILLDRDGILWMSSVNDGIFRMIFPKQQFSHYIPWAGRLYDGQDEYAAFLRQITSSGKGKNTGVKALFQTRNGDIWMTTRQREVYCLDSEKNIRQVFHAGNYEIGNVYHLMEDREGILWFSTKGQGLVCAVPDPHQPLGYRFIRSLYDEKNPLSISGNEVYFTFQDSRGRIWAGLFGGGLNLVERKGDRLFFRHKYNCFRHYPRYGLYSEVRNITEDRQGRIWVGTTDGLFSLDGRFSDPAEIRFDTYRKGMPFSHVADNDIYALYRAKDSSIWVGVFGGGLNRLVDYDTLTATPSFESFGLKEGLATDVVVAITEDDADNLWLGTESGLSRFHVPSHTFRNFDKYDSWPEVRVEEGSMVTTVSGEIWVGCSEGFYTFRPEELTTYNPAYRTYIVDFRVSNKDVRSFREPPIVEQSVKDTRELTLNYNQSMFTIEFAALNYYNQNRVSYRYLLKGYEKEWHLSGKNRIASYINVPPGNYLFQVQAVDETRPEQPSVQTLKITILPPWWKTSAAYTVYALLSLLLAWGILRFILFMIRIKNDIYIDQKLAELKIKFFTNISHELRTPLTLIQGPIQELKEKEQLSEKGNAYVELMEKNTSHMLQLVNQILDFRKIENGKMRLHVSRVSLNDLMDAFYQEFSVLAEEKGISYHTGASVENLLIWADKEKLGAAVRNVLSNAFKFTPEGGSIFLSADYGPDQTTCYIRVEDTGVGIPQHKLGEIFERFSQGDNAVRGYQGTGIGLALAKEIVSLHHGQILVESKLQKGSVFTIELKTGKEHFDASEVDFYVGDIAGTPEEEEKEETGMPDRENTGASLPVLLVVEDNTDLCKLIKLQLDDKFRVYTAANGAEGLKKVHRYHPDLVVTDQMMPEMDGLEMLQQIRKDFQISHIPVIILTAKNDDEAKTRAISMGANAYITKPFSKDYLLARIEQLLNERKLFRENVWKSVDKEAASDTDYEHYLVRKDRELLDKIHQVIEANLDNGDFNIDTIASTIGLSRSAFFKKLKSLTGLAPVDLVKEIRLNKSVELIRNTDMTITEIAFAVGFKDSGYYGKCFRKKYQQTPREFMAEYRKA